MPRALIRNSEDTLAFALTLVVTILIVAGLSYFPALTVGPILEHLTLRPN